MLRTPAGVDVPAASGGDYTADLLFDVVADAKFLRVGDTVQDRVGEEFTVLYWGTFPSDFTSGGEVILSGDTTPTQSLTTDDAIVFTPGQLDTRPRIQTDGSIITSTNGSGQLYEYEITATWTNSSEGTAATTGDHVIDSTGKSYEIARINVPGSNQWASGVFVTELEKEGESPDTGLAYLFSATPNFSFYQGRLLNTIAEDVRRNRDEFTTDVVISGIQTSVVDVTGDLYQLIASGEEFVLHEDLAASGFLTEDTLDLSASGFVTEDNLAASGFVGEHELLSTEHTDTIAQAAISGAIVAALDGAWSQLSPGDEGNIIFIEDGLPAYNSNFTIGANGDVSIGGNTTVSGDLTILGDFIGTPDLTASGFVVGPDGAGDSTLVLFDGTTGELVKELPNDADGLVLTIVSGEPAWAASSGGGGGGDISGPGSSTDNAMVRWDGTTGTVIQNSNIIVSDSGTIDFPAGTTHNVTQASGTSTFNVQNIDWLVRVDTQGQSVTVNLPPAPTDGQLHTIKDGNGNAQNNNITITAAAGQLIDPSETSLVLNLAYQAIELMWVEDPGIWHII